MESRISMRHLRCFSAVARLGSVTRAAEELGTVQPSVSRSLKELETELGTVLFDRSSAGLVPTEAGRTLMSFVFNGLGQIERGVEALRGQMTGDRVTAYVLPNVVRMIMPGAAKRFKALYPDIDIVFIGAMSSGGMQDFVRQGQVDFGFGRLLSAEHMKGLSFEHLFSEPLQFFVRAEHPLAERKGVTVQDCDRYPVVLPTRGTIIRAEIDRFVIGQGLSRFSNLTETIVFEFTHSFMMSTDAVACQPLGAMRRELARGLVKPLDMVGEPIIGAVGITRPAAHPPSDAAELLIEMIRQEVAEQGLS